MSIPLQYPKDYYQALPKIRISKKRYIVLENDILYYVKLRKENSEFKILFQCNEIQKVSVQMQRSRNGSFLYLILRPRVGKKKKYLIRNGKKFRYSSEDWKQIPDFLHYLDFIPDIFTEPGKNLHEITSSHQVAGPYRYFHSNDKLFQLYGNPAFKEEMSKAKIKTWRRFLLILGLSSLFIDLLFVIIGFASYGSVYIDTFMLVYGAVSVISLFFSLPQTLQYLKNKKFVSEKYDIAYYFK